VALVILAVLVIRRVVRFFKRAFTNVGADPPLAEPGPPPSQ
jgi:hypothetical protein